MEKHYTLLKAAQLLGVTTQTLRNWDNAGKINTIRTIGNQRRIPESEIVRLTGVTIDNTTKTERKPQRITTEKQEKPEIFENAGEIPAVTVKKEDNYVLMCKDKAVYDIVNNVVLDEGLLPGCLLSKTMSYRQWMESRYSTDTNFSAQHLIQQKFNSYDYNHAVNKTRALSLSDCYWLKEKDENITFTEVTPYVNFNDLANLFVRGKTDKRWIDTHTLLKVNSFREFEPYILCSALGMENITEAQVTDEGMILSNFTSPELFYESMEHYGVTQGEDPRELFIKKFKEHAVALFVVDYLVENNDRHPDDFGYLRSSSTGEYVSMAPYYNFDRAWSGDIIGLPDIALQGYRGYIHDLCRWAMNVATDFECGTIIERRASELLQI